MSLLVSNNLLLLLLKVLMLKAAAPRFVCETLVMNLTLRLPD